MPVTVGHRSRTITATLVTAALVSPAFVGENLKNSTLSPVPLPGGESGITANVGRPEVAPLLSPQVLSFADIKGQLRMRPLVDDNGIPKLALAFSVEPEAFITADFFDGTAGDGYCGIHIVSTLEQVVLPGSEKTSPQSNREIRLTASRDYGYAVNAVIPLSDSPIADGVYELSIRASIATAPSLDGPEVNLDKDEQGIILVDSTESAQNGFDKIRLVFSNSPTSLLLPDNSNADFFGDILAVGFEPRSISNQLPHISTENFRSENDSGVRYHIAQADEVERLEVIATKSAWYQVAVAAFNSELNELPLEERVARALVDFANQEPQRIIHLRDAAKRSTSLTLFRAVSELLPGSNEKLAWADAQTPTGRLESPSPVFLSKLSGDLRILPSIDKLGNLGIDVKLGISPSTFLGKEEDAFCRVLVSANLKRQGTTTDSEKVIQTGVTEIIASKDNGFAYLSIPAFSAATFSEPGDFDLFINTRVSQSSGPQGKPSWWNQNKHYILQIKNNSSGEKEFLIMPALPSEEYWEKEGLIAETALRLAWEDLLNAEERSTEKLDRIPTFDLIGSEIKADFFLANLRGDEAKIADFLSHGGTLEFSGSFCPPCRQLEKAMEAYFQKDIAVKFPLLKLWAEDDHGSLKDSPQPIRISKRASDALKIDRLPTMVQFKTNAAGDGLVVVRVASGFDPILGMKTLDRSKNFPHWISVSRFLSNGEEGLVIRP